MAGIGQALREAREAMGLTLDDVEQEIRIRSNYLEALENEDFDRLPGEVYVRGFLRNYARFLGVDLAENLAGDAETQEASPRTEANGDHRLSMNQPMAVPLEQSPGRIALRILIIVVIIAALAGGGYWLYRTYFAGGQTPFQLPAFLRARATATATAAPTETFTPTVEIVPTETAIQPASATATDVPAATDTAQPVSTPVPAATHTALPASTSTPMPTPTITHTPAPTNTPTITATPTVKVYRGVEVAISISERSWLQVAVDGVRVHEGILEPGDTRKWEGVRSIALRAGNGGGVVVKLNGELLGPLGEKDEVIDIEWVYEGAIEIENPTGSGAVAASNEGTTTPESIAGSQETPAAPDDLPG